MTENHSSHRDGMFGSQSIPDFHRQRPEILENAPIGFFVSTPAGKFLTVNPAMAKMLGYDTPDECVTSISDIATQIYSEPTRRDHFKHILETKGEVFNYEHQLIRKNGALLWVSTNARAVTNSPGRTSYYHGFTTPIEDRKKAEEALQENSRLLQYIMDNIYELVSLTDTDGNFTFLANSHKILGYDLDSLVGRNVLEFVHPEDLPHLSSVFREFVARRETFRQAEYRYLRADGSHLWFETIGRCILDQNGEPKELLFSTRDVTERKKTEQALRDSENRARRQRAAVAKMVLDESIFTEEISESLRRITEILSESIDVARASVWMLSEDSTELNCISLFEAKTKQHSSGDVLKITEFPEYFDAIYSESRVYAENAQTDPKTKGLTRNYLEPMGITSLLDAAVIVEGSLAGVVCLEHIGPVRQWYSDEEAFASMAASIVAQVLTNARRRQAEKEQEKLEDQLNQARKMESVGQLAGGVAHDFNNMLNVILGYAELAIGEVDPSSSLHKKLMEIRNAATRSADITRKLLAFARKQVIEPRVLDLNDTIESGLKILRRLIGEDIDLTWHPDPVLWPVKMDPSQIDQILTNLCVNARDAVSGTGKVGIETGKRTFDADYCSHHAGFLPGEYVMLAVSDNGCGMDKPVLEKLFDPFFTTKETGKGTGLGLATVYGIVKQNNGFINIYSEPGQGTAFKVFLPRHKGLQARPAPKQTQKKQHPGCGESILVVEDEPMNLDICKTMLESLGYRVMASGNPEEALAMAGSHDGEIHLLITDVVMPGINGRDLSERIHTLYPGIRCIFMSGHTADMISRKGVLNEKVNFIQKPFTISELAAKVQTVLAKKK
ncbi:MAG: PAS domain S-box protein [Desulfosalsimonadaceae bacterium]